MRTPSPLQSAVSEIPAGLDESGAAGEQPAVPCPLSSTRVEDYFARVDAETAKLSPEAADTRNAHVAEPFRSTLNEFEDALSKVARATEQPRPIKAAHELMLTKLAALTDFTPRISADPNPSEFEDVADYVCDVARIFDQWLEAVGKDARANSSASIDLDDFRGVMLKAVEGFATYQLTSCAEQVREDRAAA